MTSGVVVDDPIAGLMNIQRAFVSEREGESRSRPPTRLSHGVGKKSKNRNTRPKTLSEEQRRLIERVNGALTKHLKDGDFEDDRIVISYHEEVTEINDEVRSAIASEIVGLVARDVVDRRDTRADADRLKSKLMDALMIELQNPKKGVLRYHRCSVNSLSYVLTLRARRRRRGGNPWSAKQAERAVIARKLRNGQLK
jgi:hypothetical protein